MAKTAAAVLALALVPSALAFRDTSPLFIFSTSELTGTGNVPTIARAEAVDDQIRLLLSGCPSRTYFIVQQDGVAAADYDSINAPRLASYTTGSNDVIKSSITTEVLGVLKTGELSHYLESKCGAKVQQADNASEDESDPRVIRVSFAAPSATDLTSVLRKNDGELEYIISRLAPSKDYTVIYTTTPRDLDESHNLSSEHVYEMEDPFRDAVKMELKRDTTYIRRADNVNQGGLFEKYQYFSPGLFMAFSAMVPLVLILGVGLKAIAGLEVSYFAFSKEMGPTAQKKQ
ncbi:BIG1-domain-containing protein [Westerdykella ornata]|uniref:Protein BIG1 n=1 Tax=Westerdykella ornata TaxID=318751 RepID=A0A6A6JZ69_WESOR|nr:BIG1-domain-containing protein [Westerdykella ornata]KAF2281056.1 BIG1-domain-containing protein [Westerdykella ornata]